MVSTRSLVKAISALACVAALIGPADKLVRGQSSTDGGGNIYQDKAAGFQLALLSDWKQVSFNDAAGRAQSEFVYRNRQRGMLKISRHAGGSEKADELAREELDTLRAYRNGFELADNEVFGGGNLRGVKVGYYYVEGGMHMAETDYFLQDGSQVWELKFVGKRGVIDLIRNVTDEMSRSFKPL